MRALVYHGPGRKAWEEVPEPEITDDGDVIVRVAATTICGTDLHILKGDVPTVRDGRILGREDRIDGTQAEFVRVPYADTSTFRVPDGVRPGDVVAVVGAGPVGLAAITGAQLFSPSHIVAIDLSDARLEAAKHFGADVTVNNSREDPLSVIKDLTGRLGADVSIEAVGVPATFELAVNLARPGGRIANIGVHGEAATLHLEDQWTRDITITTGLVDTSSTPTLMRLITTGQIDAKRFITHRFDLDDFEEAYDVFARAADTSALKVVLS